MELKVICDCGQKYKFDVVPVNGQMPFAINCPTCGIDGTSSANSLITLMPPAPTAVAAPAGLRISHTVAEPPTMPSIAPPLPRPAPAGRPAAHVPLPATPKYLQTNEAIQNNSFIMGIVGALLGAVLAVGFMIGTHIFFGFSFPIFGTIMGAMIGFGARLLYRGTDSSLGAVAALIAFLTIGGTIFLMFGLLGMAFDVLYLLVGTAMAFKIASG